MHSSIRNEVCYNRKRKKGRCEREGREELRWKRKLSANCGTRAENKRQGSTAHGVIQRQRQAWVVCVDGIERFCTCSIRFSKFHWRDCYKASVHRKVQQKLCLAFRCARTIPLEKQTCKMIEKKRHEID